MCPCASCSVGVGLEDGGTGNDTVLGIPDKSDVVAEGSESCRLRRSGCRRIWKSALSSPKSIVME